MNGEITYACPECCSLDLRCEYTIVLRLGNPYEGEDQSAILDDFDQVNTLEPTNDARMLCNTCGHTEQAWTFMIEESTHES